MKNERSVAMNFSTVRVALFFKDFSHWSRSSCVGLNVAGYTTAAYLRENGVHAHAFAVRNNVDVVRWIERFNATHEKRLTHVVISAPWLSLHDLKNLVRHFPRIRFIVLSHSNVGFLQADPGGIELFRLYAKLSHRERNLFVGANNRMFTEWFDTVYEERSRVLPNLYPTRRVKGKVWIGDVLKVGAFGAIRPEKNFMTAAAAALVMRAGLRCPLELHMSSGGEGCRNTTLRAIEEMVKGLEHVRLVRHHWQYWDEFIALIKRMDLVVQVSYTESFNMITADAISNRVPVVVSEVIRWAPEEWKADADDVIDVADVGVRLLTVPQNYKGSDALIRHNRKWLERWKEYLSEEWHLR